ncbi:alpha-crystallin A chain-like [Schistocerca americana]|uniref:alpha-crystallin A chain-like n=1 Tax=Schistocerca americana TaxID=7009 RepID=UPI001F5041ED|nr:alpha-crystallin A chain-like [Schistocerca americana]
MPITDFMAKLDVNNFQPDDLSIELIDNFLKGRHPKLDTKNRFISCYITCSCILPNNFDTAALSLWLSSDGFYNVTTPQTSLPTMAAVMEDKDKLPQPNPNTVHPVSEAPYQSHYDCTLCLPSYLHD